MSESHRNGQAAPGKGADPDPDLVSVVIPARDAESTLAATLDSLVAQTHGRWEAVVVDDGSSDGTAALVASRAGGDSRIRGMDGTASGASGARNLGLAAARGRWVLFLDADDWIDARFMERMLAALRDRPDAVAAYCASRRVAPGGRLGPINSDVRLAQNPLGATARYNPVAIHAVLVEREAVQAVGGFDLDLRTCEEWDLWQRLSRLRRPWVHVHSVMSFYRTRSGSLSWDLPQLITDSETVIRRGFGSDARVAGLDVAQPDGADSAEGTADEALATVVLWFGTVDALRGGTGEAALRRLVGLPLAPGAAQESMADAVAVATHSEKAEVAANWPEYAPALTDWLARVGALSSDPVQTRRLQYRLERVLLQWAHPSAALTLGLTSSVPLDVKPGEPIRIRDGIDRVLVRKPRDTNFAMDLGALGALSRAELFRAYVARGGWRKALRLAASSRSLGPLARVPTALAAAVLRHPRRAARRSGLKQMWNEASAAALRDAGERDRPVNGHAAKLAALAHEAEAIAAAEDDARPHVAKRGVDWTSVRSGGTREMYWDDVFRSEDPWNYASAYEQEKYDRQVAILPEEPVGVALELACAEGRFTERLARRAERVIATDISRKALERAQARCRGLSNITFRQLDLIDDPLPQDLDLIVCSEVLYFLKTPETLAKTVLRFVSALKPGGRIITAHFFFLPDDPSRTGFDYAGHPYGAEVIARVFQDTPGLALEHTMQTELYRIDRYVRAEDTNRPEAVVERVKVEAPIDPEVRRYIVWGGAAVTRRQAQSERRSKIPVLMYHRIAADGPEPLRPYRVDPEVFREQVRWLRRHGYHSITSSDLPRYLSRPTFSGRPVLLTFDDGFQDFADIAWPILHDHDLTPEVFIPTDHVGKTSQWDAAAGGAFPLMDKPTLGRLRDEGVVFGSHLASHRAADGLSTHELAVELLRSRALLGQWLGSTPTSLAAPYGINDERLRRLAAECGYSVGFGTHSGCASYRSDVFNLPRIQVSGDWSLERFIAEMEGHL